MPIPKNLFDVFYVKANCERFRSLPIYQEGADQNLMTAIN